MPSALRIKELRDLNDNVMMSENGGNITLNANEIDINRISTDGTVIYLRKDGTTVGRITRRSKR